MICWKKNVKFKKIASFLHYSHFLQYSLASAIIHLLGL